MLVHQGDKYVKIFLPLAFRTTSLFYLQQGVCLVQNET